MLSRYVCHFGFHPTKSDRHSIFSPTKSIGVIGTDDVRGTNGSIVVCKSPKMLPDFSRGGLFLTNVDNDEILHREAALFAVDSQL
jgi:hypothetical protein